MYSVIISSCHNIILSHHALLLKISIMFVLICLISKLVICCCSNYSEKNWKHRRRNCSSH